LKVLWQRTRHVFRRYAQKVARDYAKTIEDTSNTTRTIVDHLMDNEYSGWFFRGQSNSEWGLLSRLGRRATESRLTQETNPLAFENSLLGEFKRNFNSSAHERPDESNLVGWLSLMQHYRAPTRLLDWTTSPLVALYFATETIDDVHDAAVWVFNPLIALGALGDNQPAAWDHLELWRAVRVENPIHTERPYLTFQDFINMRVRQLIDSASRWPFPFAPNWVDQRMAAQQSVFTVAGAVELPIEQLSYQKNRTEGVDESIRNWLLELNPREIYRKFIIRNDLKAELQVYLHRVGITAASLFPGLDGLGDTIATSEHRLIPINDYTPGAEFGVPIRRRRAQN